MDSDSARYLKDLAAVAVSVIGGWLLYRATDNLVPSVVVASVISLARAWFRGYKGNRTAFLVVVLAAVAGYSFLLAYYFRKLDL